MSCQRCPMRSERRLGMLVLAAALVASCFAGPKRPGDLRTHHHHSGAHANEIASASSWRDLSDSSAETGGNSVRSASGEQSIEPKLDMLLGADSDDKVINFQSRRVEIVGDEHKARASPATNATLEGYIRQNCTACLMREEAKLTRLEQIRRDLLEKLGFGKQPPNLTRTDLPELPRLGSFGVGRKDGYSNDQPYRLDDEHDEDYRAKTERIYTFAVKPPFVAAESSTTNDGVETTTRSDLFPASTTDLAYFPFSPETLVSDVKVATLHFYVRKPTAPTQASPSAGPSRVRVIFERVSNVNMAHKRLKFEKVEIGEASVQNLNLRWKGHWAKIDIRKQVLDWFRDPDRNYGFRIRAQLLPDPDRVEDVVSDENLAVHPSGGAVAGDNKLNMYLDMTTHYGVRSRRKRDSAYRMECTEDDRDTRCCRYPLVVDFEKFGWDWVIAPKRYFAHYCAGECPFRHLQRYVHTHVVSQTVQRGNAGPCCTPADVQPIQMIYFNENKEILVAKVPGMIVTRCGCA